MNRIFTLATILCIALFSTGTGPGNAGKITTPTDTIVYAQADTVDKPVFVRSLKIIIKANGFAAHTRLEMMVYNPNDKILDGEIEFSLAEGQFVTGFSLDISGRMRDGVIVEKKQARKAYEAIVNAKVDPGLLEMTAGNNYRLRVYPVPAKGTRKLSINISQQMIPGGTKANYLLPFILKEKVEDYQVHISCSENNAPPEAGPGMLEGIQFNGNNLFERKSNLAIDKPHAFSIPLQVNKVECSDEQNYFAVRIPFPIANIPSKKPSSVSIFWDASSSASNRDINQEISFLEAYLSAQQFSKIRLIVFRNELEEVKEFSGSASGELKEYLSKIVFDGGTDLQVINESRLWSDQNLLFSDGINNFGRNEFILTKPFYCIQSSMVSDPYLLKFIAGQSGGNYINIIGREIKQLLNEIQSLPATFIPVKGNDVSDLVAKRVNEWLVITGKVKGAKPWIEYNLTSTAIQLPVKVKAECDNNLLVEGWKAAQMDKTSVEDFKGGALVKKLGEDLKIVSPFTSLIVLETLGDYQRFDIIPPPDLIEEYYKNIEVKKKNRQQVEEEDLALSKAEIVDDLKLYLEGRRSWWKKNFPEKPKTKKDQVAIPAPTIPRQNNMVLTDSVAGNSSLSYSMATVKSEEINVVMDKEISSLNEVVVTVPYGFSNSRNTPTALSGKVPGITVKESSGHQTPGLGMDSPGNPSGHGSLIKNKIFSLQDLRRLKATEVYHYYLVLKSDNKQGAPGLYFNISTILYEKGSLHLAKRVLSNLAELQLEDHQLLKAVAYMLESWKDYKRAIFFYEKVLSIRDDEPQSYRDLALALNASGNHQAAVDLLYKVLMMGLEKTENEFKGINEIILNELNGIIDRNKEQINLKGINNEILQSLPVDLRIVIDWNKDQTDIDLHVTEPGGEDCYFSNSETLKGGKLSADMTEGYGPEEYSIRKAVKGRYLIRINYYGDSYQKVEVPSFIKLTIFKNFGKPGQQVQTKNMMMTDASGMIDVGEIFF